MSEKKLQELEGLAKAEERIMKSKLFTYFETYMEENPGQYPTMEEISIGTELEIEYTRSFMHKLFFKMYREL